MATLLIYTNINLPFAHFIVCWAFKTVAHGQNRAASRGAVCSQTALGIDVRDEELDGGIDGAELYASNVDRKIERQRKAYQRVRLCVGGWPGLVVCVLPIWCFDILVEGQTVAGSFVLSGDLYHQWVAVLSSDTTLCPPSPPFYRYYLCPRMRSEQYEGPLAKIPWHDRDRKSCKVSHVFCKMSNFLCTSSTLSLFHPNKKKADLQSLLSERRNLLAEKGGITVHNNLVTAVEAVEGGNSTCHWCQPFKRPKNSNKRLAHILRPKTKL